MAHGRVVPDAVLNEAAEGRPMVTIVNSRMRLVGGTAEDHRWPLTEPFDLVGCVGPVWVHTEPGSWWPWRWSKTYACYDIKDAPGFRVVTSDDGIQTVCVAPTPGCFRGFRDQIRILETVAINGDVHTLAVVDTPPVPFSFVKLDATLAARLGGARKDHPNAIALAMYAYHTVWTPNDRRLALEMLGTPRMAERLAPEIRAVYRQLLDGVAPPSDGDPTLLATITRMGAGVMDDPIVAGLPGYVAVVHNHLCEYPAALFTAEAPFRKGS